MEVFTISQKLEIKKVDKEIKRITPFMFYYETPSTFKFLDKSFKDLIRIKKNCIFNEFEKEIKPINVIEMFRKKEDKVISLNSEEIEVISKMFFRKYFLDFISNKIVFEDEEYDLKQVYVDFDMSPLRTIVRIDKEDLKSIYTLLYLERLQHKTKFRENFLNVVYNQIYLDINKKPLQRYDVSEFFVFLPTYEKNHYILYSWYNFYTIQSSI